MHIRNERRSCCSRRERINQRRPIDINSLFINNVNAAMSFRSKNVRSRQSAKFFQPLRHSHFHSLSLTSLDLSCGPRLSLSWRFLINVIISLCRMINWKKFNIHNWIGICSSVLASIVNRWSIRKASRIRLTLAHSHSLPLKTIVVVVYSCCCCCCCSVACDWLNWLREQCERI